MQAPSLGPAEEQDIPSQQDEGTARETDFYKQQQKQIQELQQQLIWFKYFAAVVVCLAIIHMFLGKMS